MTLLNAVPPALHMLAARSSSSSPPEGESSQQWREDGRFNYAPSFPAAVIFLVLYVIMLGSNIIQFFWYRCWFWWPMLLAITLEMIGYLNRSISIKDLNNDTSFVIMTVFLLVSPAVMAAACYMAFGRTVLWVVPVEYHSAGHLWLPARRITPLFVSFDVLSFFVQVIGGATVATANTNGQANRGKDIILGGLGLQLLTFGFFVVASIRLVVLLRRKRGQWQMPNETKWSVLLFWINIAGIIILVRSTYRFIEFALGIHNVLSDHEVFFYCLDSLLIFVVVTGFVMVHPGSYLPYLKLRRREPKFSPKAGKGLIARFSRGKGAFEVSMDERNGNAESGV